MFANYVLLQGNRSNPGSLNLINQRLLAGLRQRGHQVEVMGCDEPDERFKSQQWPRTPPEIYIYHGWPFDLDSAPGRLNVFVLNYEYSKPRPEERNLIARLNQRFDLVVVPSFFVKEMLLANGLRIDVEIVPWGVDRAEFHPVPERGSPNQPFNFLYLGAANPRKGFATVLRAYQLEFGAHEPVVLTVKESFRVRHMQEWIKGVTAPLGLKIPLPGQSILTGSPPVRWSCGFEDSVAPYHQAAHAAVYPHRGEGFGLGILESLACGTPVIVTAATGPLDFCQTGAARLIACTPRQSNGVSDVEPDLARLRAAMREAFQAGKPNQERRHEIAATVSNWTWERSWDRLDAVLRKTQPTYPPAPPSFPIKRVGYSYAARGLTSWKKLCLWYDRVLRQDYSGYVSASAAQSLPRTPLDLLVGQSEHCLEDFLWAARLNPQVKRILHLETTALQARLRIVNRERKLCGLDPILKTPMQFWRNQLECRLADVIVVPSEVSRRLFLQEGLSPAKIRVIPHGLSSRPRPRRQLAGNIMRYLFVATDPYRKGVRQLFEAWDQLRLPGAELLCLPGRDIILSLPLLKILTRNPSIILADSVPQREFSNIYQSADCQVLPSLEDSFSLAVGEAMAHGVPAIVSTETGIVDLLEAGKNAYVVEAGNLDQLKAALLHSYENRRQLLEMGQAAWQMTRRWPWSRFAYNLRQLLSEDFNS